MDGVLEMKYMGHRVPKGRERNIWRILNNGESRKKPTCDGVGPTFYGLQGFIKNGTQAAANPTRATKVPGVFEF